MRRGKWDELRRESRKPQNPFAATRRPYKAGDAIAGMCDRPDTTRFVSLVFFVVTTSPAWGVVNGHNAQKFLLKVL